MRFARIVLAVGAFLVAVSIAALGLVGRLDDAGQFGELAQDGRWGFVAALVMIAIFSVAVLPEIQRQVFGQDAVRAREVERRLHSESEIANMRQYSRARLFYELRDHISGTGSTLDSGRASRAWSGAV